jgi:hypothetical protein
VLLDALTFTWFLFALAIVTAVIGSYSSLQGLVVWPVGLLVLWMRRRGWWSIGVWAAAGSLTFALYFYNFSSAGSTPHHTYALQHPITAIKFFLFLVGNVVGVVLPFHPPLSYAAGHTPLNYAVVVFGLAIFLLALVTIVLSLRANVGGEGQVIGLALTVIGLLFAMIVTVGRVELGYWDASGSRYATFNLLIIVGIYLTLLPSYAVEVSEPEEELAAHPPPNSRNFFRRFEKLGPTVARWCLLPIVVIQVVLGFHNGLNGAQSSHTNQLEAVHVLRTINQQGNSAVSFLYIFEPASFVRREAEVLKEHHLSLFADGNGS